MLGVALFDALPSLEVIDGVAAEVIGDALLGTAEGPWSTSSELS